MSDAHGPIWIVNAPTTPYPDGRFDGSADTWAKIAAEPYGPTGAPLDPQQPTPEQIADAARDALDNIETVLMHWTFHFISDMSKLRALRDVLTPPAPKWTAKESDYEDEEDQSAPLPVLQTEDDGRVVASTGRSDSVLDVPMLSAQPADEDGNRHL